jgi:hypothetical protein
MLRGHARSANVLIRHGQMTMLAQIHTDTIVDG